MKSIPHLLFICSALILTGLAVAAPAKDSKKTKGDPWPLNTCIVAESKLGSMGKPIVYNHEGREVKFCCKKCLAKFIADPETYLQRADKKIIKQQMDHYPLTTCLVQADEKLEEGTIDKVYKNRLVRFCCKRCVRQFRKDPAAYLKKLDEAVIKAQLKDYPADHCVMSGNKLGTMGEPVNYIFANRLIRFCCTDCIKSFRKDPLKYTAMLDALKEDRKEKPAATQPK